jgi:hypothetical protein
MFESSLEAIQLLKIYKERLRVVLKSHKFDMKEGNTTIEA